MDQSSESFLGLMELIDNESSEAPGVALHRLGEVAVVVISNTSRRNALNLSMWAELEDIFRALSTDRGVSALVMRGAGRQAFAAGADISEFPVERHDLETAGRYNAQLSRTLRLLAGLEFPTLAAIQGFAVGGGCELSHACDLRIAADDAQIGIPIGRLGVVLGVTEAKYIVRHIGVNGLKRVLFSGRLFDAGESARVGLVDEVVSAADLWNHLAALTGTITASRPTTMRAAKVVTDLAEGFDERRTDQLQDLMQAAYGGDGLREGFNAFIEKRSPDFGFERKL